MDTSDTIAVNTAITTMNDLSDPKPTTAKKLAALPVFAAIGVFAGLMGALAVLGGLIALPLNTLDEATKRLEDK